MLLLRDLVEVMQTKGINHWQLFSDVSFHLVFIQEALESFLWQVLFKSLWFNLVYDVHSGQPCGHC